jgi:hypothetical protein
MFQHLDDPVPLPSASIAQRQADMDRGAGLRRRRRAAVVAVPFGAAVLTAVVVAFSSWSSGLTETGPAAPPAQSSSPPTLSGPPNTAEPVYSACPDPVGDSAGEPDLRLVALDGAAYPLIHYHWDGSHLPRTGNVEALFLATSADGRQSRQLGVVIVDGTVKSQFVLNPATGEQQTLDPGADIDTSGGGGPQQGVDLSVNSLNAVFPGSAFMALGAEWTWTASITVDGAVVDVCDQMVP